MKPIYIIIALISLTAFAIDPSVYDPYQTPKLVVLVIIPLAGIVLMLLYRVTKKQPVKVSISIIECLLLIELIWDAIGNPSLLRGIDDFELLSLVSFFLVVFIVRQAQIGEGYSTTEILC